jgi:hypothetical protein
MCRLHGQHLGFAVVIAVRVSCVPTRTGFSALMMSERCHGQRNVSGQSRANWSCFRNTCLFWGGMSFGRQRAARGGVRVPEQLSVLGFTNILAPFTAPALCSHELYPFEAGVAAVR